jgi:hypothetical protein
MFALDRFYNVLHDNLISKLPNGESVWCYPFGTYDGHESITVPKPHQAKTNFQCHFYDQEPYYDFSLDIIKNSIENSHRRMNRFCILANSEHSKLKTQFVKSNNYHDWYYFFHGFAALDWYRDFQYMNPSSFNQFDKVFICYNHLTSNLRSYRLHLVSNLITQDLIQYGRVSLFLKDNAGTWQETVEDPNSPLDIRAKSKIHTALADLTQPLTIDTLKPSGNLSADVNFADLTSALWHVVTETVYFNSKLHLTEKVFKPIVAQRPFILVAAPGNLAYLKSYGFRTFDQWIDESYDQETDHYLRIEKITEEIAKLCAQEPGDLIMMHRDMQETLEYNFHHFYTTFKDCIVDELVDNFEQVLDQINTGATPIIHSINPHQQFNFPMGYLAEVKKRLKQ